MGSSSDDGTLQKDDGLGWGKSLPVDSVQEMVRRDSQSVPERYIRNDIDRPQDAEFSALIHDIPVIDFSLLLSEDKDEQEKLHQACKEWGFFQAVNHGIPEKVLQEVKTAASEFFELPLEEKKKYSMASNDLQGYGQAYVVSDKQKLDWGDLIFLMTQPTKIRKLNYWPTAVEGFVDAVDAYTNEVQRVAMELLAHLSLLMNMDRDSLLELHGEMKLGVRMNYYPTCSRPDLVLGVSPHSDGSAITILLQDDEIVGLQIRHNGCWIPVKPIPSALVVNIGDVMEVWSNGMYKSIEHRAVTHAKKARMSLAAFVLPDPEVEIGPVDQAADNHHRPKTYKSFKYIDYIRHTLERKMEGKAHTQFLKLENE